MPIKVKYSKRWRRGLNAIVRRDERKDSAEYKRRKSESCDE